MSQAAAWPTPATKKLKLLCLGIPTWGSPYNTPCSDLNSESPEVCVGLLLPGLAGLCLAGLPATLPFIGKAVRE